MTREEVAENHLNKHGLSVNKGEVGRRIQQSVYEAMDEWAKVQSIEFVGWLNDNYWIQDPFPNIHTQIRMWNRYDYDNEPQTTEQLYELFLQSQNKQ